MGKLSQKKNRRRNVCIEKKKKTKRNFSCVYSFLKLREFFCSKYRGSWKNLQCEETIEFMFKLNKQKIVTFLCSFLEFHFAISLSSTQSLRKNWIKLFFWHSRHQNNFPWILHTRLIPKHNSVDPQKTNKHDVQSKHFQPFELFFFIRLFIPEKCFRMKFGEIPKRKNAAHDSTQLWCGREKGNSFEPFFAFALSFVRHTSGSR